MPTQRVRRPSLTFKRVEFLNGKILAAEKANNLYVDMHTVCTALRLSPSSQILRMAKSEKTILKGSYQNKVVRLLSEDDAQWWLDTLTDELLNKYAGRLVIEYRKALISTLRSAFFDGPPKVEEKIQLGSTPSVEEKANEDLNEIIRSAYSEVGSINENSQRIIAHLSKDNADSGDVLDIYKRMEENRKIRDKAILLNKESEAEIQRCQELINKDLATVNARMSPGSRFYPSGFVMVGPDMDGFVTGKKNIS